MSLLRYGTWRFWAPLGTPLVRCFLQNTIQFLPREVMPAGYKYAYSLVSVCPSAHVNLHHTWFPGPTQVHNPNGISIGPAVFAGITSVTDRPTERPTEVVM